MEPAKTNNELRSYLGMCNAYKNSFKDVATISASLNKLLKKTAADAIETLTDYQRTSFVTIKRQLASSPVLALPLEDLLYVQDTDANAK